EEAVGAEQYVAHHVIVCPGSRAAKRNLRPRLAAAIRSASGAHSRPEPAGEETDLALHALARRGERIAQTVEGRSQRVAGARHALRDRVRQALEARAGGPAGATRLRAHLGEHRLELGEALLELLGPPPHRGRGRRARA